MTAPGRGGNPEVTVADRVAHQVRHRRVGATWKRGRVEVLVPGLGRCLGQRDRQRGQDSQHRGHNPAPKTA